MIALCAAGLVGLTGCSADPATEAASGQVALPVVASFYPLEWVAQRLGGNQVSVTGLTPIGAEPHDLVLGPRARQAMDKAAVVLYLGSSFQPDVERTVAQLPADVEKVDLLTSPRVHLLAAPSDLGKESLDGGKDPHVWLDPVRVSLMAERAADAIIAKRPDLAGAIRSRLGVLKADLATLDKELTTELTTCRRRTIVTSHAAFGYLADRYHLEQIAIAGISPDTEPDPGALRKVADSARQAGVTTVFFEEALPPHLAKTVAGEIGARTDLLGALEFDPAAAVGPGEDYLSVMRRNGKALSRGLGCTT